MPNARDQAFDTVELPGSGGQIQRLTRAQFEALPLDQRVRAILSKQARFLRGGTEVPARQALLAR